MPAALGSTQRLISRVFLAVVCLGILVGIWQMSGLRQNIYLAMGELRNAQQDNRTRGIAQAETDLMAYRLALEEAREALSADARARLRRRFDIFYSRVETIRNTLEMTPFLNQPSLTDPWAGIVQMTRDDAKIFDGGDFAVTDRLADLERHAVAATPKVRTFVVEGLQQMIGGDMSLRERTLALLDNFFNWTIVMIGMLIALAGGVLLALYWIMRYARLKAHLSTRQTKVINASVDAVLICDAGGKLLEFNNAAERLLQLTRHPAEPMRLDQLFVPGQPGHGAPGRDADDRPIAHWRRLARSDAAVTSAVRRRDGLQIPVECVFTVHSDLDGRSIFIVFVRDISRRLENEHRLEASRDAAERGERAKSRFLAVMSHEMRTPLNGLIAALDLLQDTTRLSRRQAEFLSIARQCGNTTLEQIDDVLELTRLEEKPSEADTADFDIAGLIGSIVEHNRPLATLRHNRPRVTRLGRGAGHVHGEVRLIKRIVTNLLGNAIKFTENGTIDLTLTVEPETDTGRELIRVAVADTGIGIPADKQELIFRDFETIDSSGTRLSEGSGLGLGIVRRAMRRLGGSVGVHSEPGKGGTFTVEFSLAEAEGPRAGVPEEAPSAPVPRQPMRKSGLTVLVAEDNPINRRVLGEMLRHHGCHVHEARTGAEAVRQAAKRVFDIILMDLSMPEMDGLEASAPIRQGGASAQSRIVGVTAHVGADTDPQARRAGMDAVLIKPIRLETIARLLAENRAVDPPAAPADQAILWEGPLSDLRLSFGPAEMGRMIGAYMSETDAGLRRLAEEPEAPGVFDAVHRMIGSAAIFGAARLGGLLKEIETLGRAGDSAILSRRLPDIRTCWFETRHALKAWSKGDAELTFDNSANT